MLFNTSYVKSIVTIYIIINSCAYLSYQMLQNEHHNHPIVPSCRTIICTMPMVTEQLFIRYALINGANRFVV